MNEIFVTGHRNPDLDSIVSAIAYASLRSALGDRGYVAAHQDRINEDTDRILDFFGMEPPIRIRDLRTQVRDLDIDTPPALNASVTMDRAWNVIQEHGIESIPVINEDGTLYGMLTAANITGYNMQAIESGRIDAIPIFNLLSVLEGRLIAEVPDKDSLTGEIVIALPQEHESLLFHSPGAIVICGAQPDMIRRAFDLHAECVILCQTEIDPEWIKDPGNTVIIATPFDARYTASQIIQAMPISRHCQTEKVVSFHLSDYLDDVREKMLESRNTTYPVLNGEEKVVGTISRYHLLRPRRKQVVLVDHNELAQSVPGLQQAEILEIIDHHRLADIQTRQPIRVRNEPVGSTTTIIAEMYQQHGVIPSRKLAGLMASAILADTVMFKSPTCTKRDIAMAERLARIGAITLEEIGQQLFSSSYRDESDLKDLVYRDLKEFFMADQKFGVGQITSYDSEPLLKLKKELLKIMDDLTKERDYSFALLMVTDVLEGGTHLLYNGSDDIIRHAFQTEPKDNMIYLPGVMSRKKQVIPMLTELWG